MAKRFGQIGQPPRAEHHQGDDRDEKQMYRILNAHPPQASADAGPTLSAVAQEPTSSPSPPHQGRLYPPPPDSEPFWPSQLTILVAIVLQFTLPARLTIGPVWLVPSMEGALLLGMFFATPRELEFEHPRRRRVALVMIAFVTAANIFSLVALSKYLLHNTIHTNGTNSGRELIISGTLIWLTNFLIFGLWYWELDRGGPGKRASGHDGPPDFLFPQMSDDQIEPREWRPKFIDYLYVSLTNATAFSPTDTMPLSAMAKSVMGIQSIVSLVTIGLIVSRAVNVL
jgi:uncharacterized membrane protein